MDLGSFARSRKVGKVKRLTVIQFIKAHVKCVLCTGIPDISVAKRIHEEFSLRFPGIYVERKNLRPHNSTRIIIGKNRQIQIVQMYSSQHWNNVLKSPEISAATTFRKTVAVLFSSRARASP